MNKTNASFVFVLESSNLWHGRLGHVNYGYLKRLINLNHIPTFQIDIKHKCETCVEAKMTRLSFQTVGDYCAQHGIRDEVTPPYSPQLNGVAKRKNYTLKEMMNAMLISSRLPHNVWGEAILLANYLLNKVP